MSLNSTIAYTSDDNVSNSQMKYIIILKIISLLVIAFITILFGFLPLYFGHFKKSTKFLGFANSFSGGLFMGIGLFHLLPEANECFEDYFSSKGKDSIFSDKPISYFIAFLSYSLILLLEKVAFDSHSLTEHTHKHLDIEDKEEEIHKKEDEGEDKLPLIPKEKNDNIKKQKISHKEDLADQYFNTNQKKNTQGNSEIFHDCFAFKDIGQKEKAELTEIDTDQDEYTLRNVVSSKGKFASYLQARNIMQSNDSIQTDKSLFAASKILERTMKPHGKVDRKILDDDNNDIELKIENTNVPDFHRFHPTSIITPYILLIALSLHGLFEGTALGVMSKIRHTIYLLLVILAHKWAEAFALGMSFAKSGTQMSTYSKMIVIFSLFTPCGIIIGIYFSTANAFVQGSLLSVSGGTFIYVSASEVIVEEFAITKYRIRKYIAYLLGGILVGALAWFEVKDD